MEARKKMACAPFWQKVEWKEGEISWKNLSRNENETKRTEHSSLSGTVCSNDDTPCLRDEQTKALSKNHVELLVHSRFSFWPSSCCHTCWWTWFVFSTSVQWVSSVSLSGQRRFWWGVGVLRHEHASACCNKDFRSAAERKYRGGMHPHTHTTHTIVTRCNHTWPHACRFTKKLTCWSNCTTSTLSSTWGKLLSLPPECHLQWKFVPLAR